MTKNLVGAGYEKLEIGSGQDMSFSKENFSPDPIFPFPLF